MGRSRWREPVPARPFGISRESRTARRCAGPSHQKLAARHRAGSRVEWADAPGGRAGGWLCLEWQDLPQSVKGRVRDHRHTLERPKVLRTSGPSVERTTLIMKSASTKPIRCAIYTRVSTD